MKQHGRDNHYVPQFYLKRWSTNGHSVLDYRTIISHPNEPAWKRSSIKHSAYWRDLYTQHNQKDINTEIEDFFADVIEAPSWPVFRKLDNAEALSAGDVNILVNLLIAQLFRTPHAMLYEAQINRQIFEKTVINSYAKVERDLNHGSINLDEIGRISGPLNNSPFPSMPLKFVLDNEKNEILVSMSVGRQSFLSAFDNLYNGTVGMSLRSYPWKVVTVPIGVELPTSDNPVVVFGISSSDDRLNFRVGIGMPNTIILFPLDTRRALFTQVGIPPHRLLAFEPDSYYSNLFIKAIVLNADQHVYAKKKLPCVEMIRPREINPEKIENLNRTRQDWNEIQVNVDERIS